MRYYFHKYLRFYQTKRKKKNMTNLDNMANPRMNNKILTILHKIISQRMSNSDREDKTKTHIITISQLLHVMFFIL